MLVLKSPPFYLVMAPKCESSDVGNSGIPERSQKVLPLGEKVKVLDLREKHPMLRLLRSM